MKKNLGQLGFSLIEMLIVLSVLTIMMTFIIVNFGSQRLDITHTTNYIVALLREVQNQVAAGAQYGGGTRCGFGVVLQDPSHIIITTTFALLNNCAAQDKNFDPSDTIMRTITLPDPEVTIKNNFLNIFYEPPKPLIYVNNNSSGNAPPSQIQVGPRNTDCSVSASSCKTICVYTSGRIETVSSSISCPAN